MRGANETFYLLSAPRFLPIFSLFRAAPQLTKLMTSLFTLYYRFLKNPSSFQEVTETTEEPEVDEEDVKLNATEKPAVDEKDVKFKEVPIDDNEKEPSL